jgi:tellurite resistance protein
MSGTLSAQEALIYAMVTTSAVDRTMSSPELARIGSIVSQLPMFEGFKGDLVDVSQACGRVLSADDGLTNVLNLIAGAVSGDLAETTYMLALEVAAVDLYVNDEEIRFLELLADALKLDRLVIAALERGARARHQRV